MTFLTFWLMFKFVFVIKHTFRAPFSTLNHDSGSIFHVDFDFNTPRALGTLFWWVVNDSFMIFRKRFSKNRKIEIFQKSPPYQETLKKHISDAKTWFLKCFPKKWKKWKSLIFMIFIIFHDVPFLLFCDIFHIFHVSNFFIFWQILYRRETPYVSFVF